MTKASKILNQLNTDMEREDNDSTLGYIRDNTVPYLFWPRKLNDILEISLEIAPK